ncbi:MAG TPA: histidine triad nucleotide-binding protein [Clostridiales bacterium]|nr:histidine triad nucleotide-binding protein [Clostridiales bacterium]
MGDCIFCKIANKDVSSKIIYEDDTILVFEDVNPQAPVHVLIIPKQHIPSLNDIDSDAAEIISHIFMKIPSLAEQLGVQDNGYRIVVNCGTDGGQSVGHLHYHLLGGRTLTWPPG